MTSIPLLFHNIHGARSPEVIYMEEILVFSLQIERIKSISLLACPSVNNLASISIENGPFAISQPEP